MRDRFGRPLRSLRISVTDRCNMRCRYCMPEDEYVWLPRESILTFEEIERLVRVFSGLGVDKVRLTGGEPLLRHELATLVAMLDRVPGLKDLALTTNGLLLAREAEALRRAGLARVTVSLDTLRPARMREFAKSTRHDDVVAGIQAARQVGFRHLKLNTVVVRGFNDDELADLIEFGRSHDAEVRFIEYMDVGGATRWTTDQVVPQRGGRGAHPADRRRVAWPERRRGGGAPRRGGAGGLVPPRDTARRSPPGDAHAGRVRGPRGAPHPAALEPKGP